MNKISVNGFEMSYQDEGSGPVLLMVHGFPLTSLMWNPQIVEFRRSYRVIAPDLRGLGQSANGAPVGRFCTMDEYADDLAALLDGLGLGQQKVVVMGLSMGGYVTFAFYRKYTERVRALVLCDTRSEADTPEGRAGRYRLIEDVKMQGSRAAVNVMMPKMFAPETYAARPDMVAQLAGLMENNSPAGIMAAASAMAERPDSTPGLPDILVPTLVVVGKDDLLMPPDGARQMAQSIPDWQLSIVPHAGHMSNLENPEFFNQAVETFLKGLK